MRKPRQKNYRKPHAPALRTSWSSRETPLRRASFRLCAKERGCLTPKQLESIRLRILRGVRRRVTSKKVQLRIKRKQRKKEPKYKPYLVFHVNKKFLGVTQKSKGARIGKGKGKVAKWVSPVRPGRVLLELGQIPDWVGWRVIAVIQTKLPIASFVLSREDLHWVKRNRVEYKGG